MNPKIVNWVATLVAVAVLAMGTVTAAMASPATVSLYAGGCYGQGGSYLQSPGGYAYTSGCGLGNQYLSATVAFAGGGTMTKDGAWYAYDVLWGNNGLGAAGSVSAVAGTHNLTFLGTYNGFVGTNTW
jgi:hypothetical protein